MDGSIGRKTMGLKLTDYYPKSYIYKPSERMLRFWKEHEKKESDISVKQ